jgi:methionine-gamma-lyase
LLTTVDIEAVSKATKRANAILVVDSTYATPLITKPISLGADLVLLNASGVLTGHNDVVAGLVCGSQKYISAVKSTGVKEMIGCVLSPEDASLALRGMQTLDLRLFEACENARAIAEFLDGDVVVKQVYYPGLAKNEQCEMAKRQMNQFGNMVGFSLNCKRGEVDNFLEELQVIRISDQPGGNGTVVYLVDKAVFEYGTQDEKMAGITLMQMSVGIEDAHDLMADLNRGLNAIAKLKGLRRIPKQEKVAQGKSYPTWVFIAALLIPIMIGIIAGLFLT